MSEEPLANKSSPSSAVPEAEYDLIFATLSQTGQGRRFLEEYARRCHPSDAHASLAAIERMQAVLREGGTSERLQILLEMVDMAQAIGHLRAEILAMRPPSPLEATGELDSIVQMTEDATARILSAAEQVQEIAWTMRETGSIEALCDELDARATDIYTACSFQDLTGQRTRKVIQVLRYLEDRLNALVAGQGPTASPEEAGASSLLQAGVDAVMGPEAAAPEGTAQDRQDATLEDINRRMLAMEPAIGSPPAAGDEAAATAPAAEDVRPELSVVERIIAEEPAMQRLTDWAVHPPTAAADPSSTKNPETVDWVVEHPQAPQPDAEPAWMILRRIENELAEPAEPAADDVSMPLPSTPPAQPAPPSAAVEPALAVAETVSQLAEELRPAPSQAAAEPALWTKLSAADRLTASPVKQPRPELPSSLMQRAAAVVTAPRAADAKAHDKPAESDPDDFLFAPDEKTSPSAAELIQPPAAMPESSPEPEAEPEAAKTADHDPLSPLRTMSDAQKIALFS